MFNAAWTDAPHQTVGQRKQRKTRGSIETSTTTLTSSSRSIDGSRPQSRPPILTLFHEHRKDGQQQQQQQPPSRASTARESTERRFSTYTLDSQSSSPELVDRAVTPRRARKESNHSSAANVDSDYSEVPESVFSDTTALSGETDCFYNSGFQSISKSQLVQPLSPSSFVTQKTEVTVSSSSSIRASEQYAAVVRISAEGCPIDVLGSPKTPLTSAFDAPRGKVEGWGAAADAWHPPDAWECTPEGSPLRGSLGAPFHMPRAQREKERAVPPPFEVTHLQRSIRRMEAASPKIALERLKEEWMEVEDSQDYRELELEKQLWMLSALRTLNRLKVAEAPGGAPIAQKPSTSAKALSLYENLASASFLSALLPHVEIHHISTTPLSPRNYPNVHPIEVPSRTPQLPYASNNFTSIHGFTIPTLLPASSIPILLKECYRTLVSKTPTTSPASNGQSQTSLFPPPPQSIYRQSGTLHLTLLDPCPLPPTLGPRLRAWLEDHLIFNLEKQFRCINPMRLFPLWLADAGLRAQGSTITSVRFLASVPAGLKLGNGMGTGTDENNGAVGTGAGRLGGGEGVRQELKSILGRMLWKEMWGAFVQGDKWWWEDEMVVAECERMGTVWEYAIVEAVKEG